MLGQGDCGQLGLGDSVPEAGLPCLSPITDLNHPVSLLVITGKAAAPYKQCHTHTDTSPLFMQVKSIAAGGMHSLVVTGNGRLFSCGVNDEGALGRKTVTLHL